MNVNAVSARSTPRGVALSVATAWIVSAVVCTVVSLGAQALGADASVIMGLEPALYLIFALVGLLIAAAVWALVRSRAARPHTVMNVMVPVVVVVSLVPDVLVGIAGLGWIGAIALMLMHLGVAAAGVTALRRFLPLSG